MVNYQYLSQNISTEAWVVPKFLTIPEVFAEIIYQLLLCFTSKIKKLIQLCYLLPSNGFFGATTPSEFKASREELYEFLE